MNDSHSETPDGASPEPGFDAAAAARLVSATESSMGQALDVRAGAQYLAWGLAWLIGLGTMWINALLQHPYVEPAGWTTVVLVVLLAIALIVTVVSTARATDGLGGVNAFRGQVFGTAWGVGFAGFWLGVFALSRYGLAPSTMGIVTGAGSIGLTGLIYLLGSGLWADRVMTALGVWLVVVAVVGAFAGPLWLLGLGTIAGGGGFLMAAALVRNRRGR